MIKNFFFTDFHVAQIATLLLFPVFSKFGRGVKLLNAVRHLRYVIFQMAEVISPVTKKVEFIIGRAVNICTKTGISCSRASKNPDFRVNL